MTIDKDNIWELYGVKQNPFDTSPILVRGGNISPESFVGRESDVKRLTRLFSSKGGSRALVYGDIGVGKTSFVNVVRYYAMEKGFFTPFKEIAVQEEWNTDSFLFNTLGAIYATLKLLKDKPVSDTTLKKMDALFGIGSKDLQVGVSIMGTGGNYGEQTKGGNVLTTMTLTNFFQEIISEIMVKTKKEVILHYNNLELLSESKLRKMFENLRDLLQTPGVHFVFVGNSTVHSNFQSIPRVSSILSDTPILIETLKINEIQEIIRKRFESLRISRDLNYIIPFTHDAILSLYELWGGNIRNILNSLSTATLEITKERPLVLDKNALAVTLKNVLEKRYFCKLQNKPKEVLLEMVQHEEITNKGLSDKLRIARSNMSTYLKDLQTAGMVILRRKTGKDKFWSVEPKIKWHLLEVDKDQKSLYSYLENSIS